MSRLLIAAFATLGLVVSSALAAVLLTGLAEGIRPLPDPVATLTGHTGKILALAFAPGGKKLYSGSADRTLRQWKLP